MMSQGELGSQILCDSVCPNLFCNCFFLQNWHCIVDDIFHPLVRSSALQCHDLEISLELSDYLLDFCSQKFYILCGETRL